MLWLIVDPGFHGLEVNVRTTRPPSTIYTMWCMLSHTTAIPHMVCQENASAYCVHIVLLIWNNLTRNTEVTRVNELGKVCDVIWLGSRIVEKNNCFVVHQYSLKNSCKCFKMILKVFWTAKHILFFWNIQHLIYGKKGYFWGETPSSPKKWSNMPPKQVFIIFSENIDFFLNMAEKNIYIPKYRWSVPHIFKQPADLFDALYRSSGALPVKEIFWCSSKSCRLTMRMQIFYISSCNTQTIVAPSASCEKCAAISCRMSVIVRRQWSSKRAHIHHTVLSNIVLSCPLHSTLCMFVPLSWNIDCHRWMFLKFTFCSL